MPARSIARCAAGLALSVLALSACAPANDEPEPEPSVSASAPAPSAPASTPPPSSATTDYGTGIDVSGWQTITVPSGSARFRIPADWTVRDDGGGGIDQLAVLRGDGQFQLLYTDGTGDDTGAACTVDDSGQVQAFPTEVYEATPVTLPGSLDAQQPAAGAEPAFGAFAQETSPGHVVFGMGLLPLSDAQAPECLTAFRILGPAGGVTFASETQVGGFGEASVWVVDSFAQAQAYTQTEEYRVIKTVLLTLEWVRP